MQDAGAAAFNKFSRSVPSSLCTHSKVLILTKLPLSRRMSNFDREVERNTPNLACEPCFSNLEPSCVISPMPPANLEAPLLFCPLPSISGSDWLRFSFSIERTQPPYSLEKYQGLPETPSLTTNPGEDEAEDGGQKHRLISSNPLSMRTLTSKTFLTKWIPSLKK